MIQKTIGIGLISLSPVPLLLSFWNSDDMREMSFVSPADPQGSVSLFFFSLLSLHDSDRFPSFCRVAHNCCLCPLHCAFEPVKPIWKWKNSWWNEEERRNEKAKLSAPSLAKGAKAGNIHLIDRFSGTLPYRIHTAQHVHRDWFREYHLFWNPRYKLGKSHVFSPIGTWHSTKNYVTHQKV